VKTKLLAAAALAASVYVAVSAQPVAAIDVSVRVTIERIRALDGFGAEDADFYAVVNIDGNEFDNKDSPSQDANEDDDDISPNWEFARSVDASRGSIPLTINIFDEDGFLRFDDDHADVDSRPGRGLELSVTLAPCAISGDFNDGCGVSLVSAGTQDDRAELTFKVEVIEPASSPGLRTRCIHSPIWPQPGQAVTISLESLDGAYAPRLADNVEIWVDDRSAPALSSNGASTASFTTAPVGGTQLSYACRVRDDSGALVAFTGWRTVGVGPQAGSAAPVLVTGPTASRMDIVFIGDRDDYTSASDPTLLADVQSVILNGYYAKNPNNPGASFAPAGYDVFLSNHDKFNFWIAAELGDAEDAGSGCDHEAPDINFADTGALLHKDDFRDCAPGGQRLFSSEPTSVGTLLHETGHRPFGLADEYCCDGGYFQTDTDPNLYEEPEDCTGDAGNLGRPASACREFDETIENWFDSDWSVSEPATNDLMNDRGAPQAADLRRINGILNGCLSARC
jgi:hypothetical protein